MTLVMVGNARLRVLYTQHRVHHCGRNLPVIPVFGSIGAAQIIL